MQHAPADLLMHPRVLAGLAVINAAGALYGFYWYRFQLATTPWPFWPFVPECPIQASLFAIVAYMLLAGRRNAFLETVTYLGLVKYGSWTVFVLSLFGLSGGQFDVEKLFLLLSHVGMTFEGLVFLRFLPRPGWLLVAVPAWFAAMDFLDYAVGIHPRLPDPAHLPQALLFAALGTGFATCWLLWRQAQPDLRQR